MSNVRLLHIVDAEPQPTSTAGYLRFLGWTLMILLYLDWALALTVYGRYPWALWWGAQALQIALLADARWRTT